MRSLQPSCAFRLAVTQTVRGLRLRCLFVTVTLQDFDCGVDRPQCEEVTSTDHSSYEGGENVTVTKYDDYVSFENKRGLISNAENNPADVVLTEEQKSMHNCAKWLCTILMAGITNKQWEGVVTPSPTPHLTESNPTPSPTPSPTCAFSIVSGQCTVECDRISSPNYPGDYSASDHCARYRTTGARVPHGTGL